MPPVAPPPPKKSRVGLILGIVGGVVVLVVGGLVALGAIGYKAATSFPEGKRKLTLPQTLLDGKYELAKDLSDTEGKQIGQEADGAWDAKDTHGVVAATAWAATRPRAPWWCRACTAGSRTPTRPGAT